MRFLRQLNRLWAVVFVAAVVLPLGAQPAPPAPAPANLAPPMPPNNSPVDSFRQLLSLSASERASHLTNKPPEIRERLLNKVKEYLALDPNERELRLRATELRWYLLPLLHDTTANRATRLAAIPEHLRGLVQSRLEQWDALPAEFRREFLDNEKTLRYFSAVNSTNAPEIGRYHTPDPNEQARWNALSAAERQKITNQFNQFFALTSDEKQKTLGTLSDTERAQMEKTLQSFSSLPTAQRVQCVRAFTEFAGMDPKDRAEFLKNAERWSQMAPKERQAWRDLVAAVPQWPPLPPSMTMPPMPPPPPRLSTQAVQRGRSVIATNAD